jgi:hypothetical protein
MYVTDGQVYRDVDIVPKPCVWSHGALAVLFETQPTFRTTVDGKDGDLTPLHAGAASTLDYPVSLMHVMWKFSYIDQ